MVSWVQNWSKVVTGAGFSPGIYLGANDPLSQADFNAFTTDGVIQHLWLSASSSADVHPSAGYQAVQTALEQPLCGQNVDLDTLQTDTKGGQVTGLAPQ